MPKGKLSLIIGLLALATTRIYAGEFSDSWTWDDTPQARSVHAALEGKPMPPLTVTGWLNGKVEADAMKGKVVIVDFYATWCGPCTAAIPHNNEMLEKYQGKGLVIVGVCTSSKGQENMADVVKTKGIKYPTALDPKLASEKAWAVQYYPTYAVVDRKGVVRAIGLQPQHVEAVVQKLLAEQP